eukprot:TRINITY_DN112286_c0_g1_i1.p1 TRINITY_DN112286_c0_g1~~TRINITY_DN112286_c0_g1_i1.p1  ORF type:complete len:266 (+),score=54.17 TRINITY_DN112286_c0_g1_i1:89-886(+)
MLQCTVWLAHCIATKRRPCDGRTSAEVPTSSLTGRPRRSMRRTSSERCRSRTALRARSSMDSKAALQILELDIDIRQLSETALKRAFRQQALRWHPDVQGGEVVRFREVMQAYKLLSRGPLLSGPDPATRARKRRRRKSSTDDVSIDGEGMRTEFTERLWEEILDEAEEAEDGNRQKESPRRENKYVDNSLMEDVERLENKKWPWQQPGSQQTWQQPGKANGWRQPGRLRSSGGSLGLLVNFMFMINVYLLFRGNFPMPSNELLP